ncbi:hypothetical protein CPT_Sansa82 [Caulobacter phage Sansa]|uniref:Uncharacterized protein n=1 Tax=Caulobacter phage Sansa TaxID=1675600 RepID=A0A0K1LLV6_9CAUD|nr:hypothetical protein HOR07_gp082 [Caulobacter phage Sansa]AKU43486.1 hypothetical protein CPT_Sansa82 [Caulobacter phage Sansa]
MNDLFGDLPASKRPQKPQERPKTAAAPQRPAERSSPAPAPAPVAAPTPCGRDFLGAHKCRVGGGHAYYSDDFGRTWFCDQHMPPNFLPKRP